MPYLLDSCPVVPYLLDSCPIVAILLEVVDLAAPHQEVLSAEAPLLVDQEATGANDPDLRTVVSGTHNNARPSDLRRLVAD